MPGIEWAMKECNKRAYQEVAEIFPGVDLEGLLVIPTFQRSRNDLVQMGEKIEDEKNALLERFFLFAKAVCGDVEQQGGWADYIDPCSGLPMIHRHAGMKVYSEVEGAAALLGYSTINAGCCKVMIHPTFGTKVYPASLFARVPEGGREAVEAALERASQLLPEWC